MEKISQVEPIVVGGLDITREFVASCDRAAAAEMRAAEHEQKAAAREAASLGLEGSVVAGEPVASIHPTLFHYWGQREGYEIWSDPKELETFKRDNPEIRPARKRAPVVAGWRPGGAPDPASPLTGLRRVRPAANGRRCVGRYILR